MIKKNKNIISNKKYFIGSVYFLIVFDLFLLYLIKYVNQKLSLLEFHFFYFGNFLNFLISIITFTGVTILFVKKSGAGISKRKTSILIFPVIITILLITAFITSKVPMNFGNSYFLQQPLSKFIVDAVFILFEICQIMYLSYIWMIIMGRNEFLLLRSFLNSTVIFVGLIGFAFFFSIFSMQEKSLSSKNCTNAEIAVVFGSAVWSDNKPSPSLSKRVEKAVDLYQAGTVKRIQLTGGNAPGELAEAEVAYNYLKKFRVNMKDVVIEKKTTSTIEQVQFIKQNLVEKEQMQKIIVVSDMFHLNRINEICSFHNIKPQLVSSDLTFSWEKNVYYKFRESIGLIFFWLFAI